MNPIELHVRGRLNDVSEAEVGEMKHMEVTHVEFQRADCLAPGATHIRRCPVAACRAPIELIERAVAGLNVRD